MDVRIKHIIFLFLIFCLSGQVIFSQNYKTRNNYTGTWKTPTSWDPVWPLPQYEINNSDITIDGYITADSSLSISGNPVKMLINDTLVIRGNLTINNNVELQVNENGILIVLGNLTFSNTSRIIANNYIIVTGNVIKLGSIDNGEFSSDDNPVKVFIGGSFSPADLTNNKPNFPALNCASPPTIPYPHSGCSYGDMTDIIDDPIYPFYQSVFSTATLTSSDADNSFCAGTSVTFTSGGGIEYDFRVDGISVQKSESTTYTTTTLTNGMIVDVLVTITGGFKVASSGIINTVYETPVAFAGPDQELNFVFSTQMAAELYSPGTGEWSLISGSGQISDINSPTTMITELSPGENVFLWKVQNEICMASDEVKITVSDLFVPSVITPDGDGKNDYFKIGENYGKAELIIFNRWGNQEYINSNYANDWDGRNSDGAELPYDTYFYVLKLENGLIKKGSVLIIR